MCQALIMKMCKSNAQNMFLFDGMIQASIKSGYIGFDMSLKLSTCCSFNHITGERSNSLFAN